jgi:hypothetical protein
LEFGSTFGKIKEGELQFTNEQIFDSTRFDRQEGDAPQGESRPLQVGQNLHEAPHKEAMARAED